MKCVPICTILLLVYVVALHFIATVYDEYI